MMPEIYTKIIGNVFDDDGDGKKYDETAKYDTIHISRTDMPKRRQLVTSKSGTKIGISLTQGRALQHGDILQNEKNCLVIVKQVPEKVIMLRLTRRDNYLTPMLVGHVIGNMHRPIAIKSDEKMLLFPIQDDAELEMFENKFANVSDDIKMIISQEIFIPHRGADTHGHQ